MSTFINDIPKLAQPNAQLCNLKLSIPVESKLVNAKKFIHYQIRIFWCENIKFYQQVDTKCIFVVTSSREYERILKNENKMSKISEFRRKPICWASKFLQITDHKWFFQTEFIIIITKKAIYILNNANDLFKYAKKSKNLPKETLH